MGGAFIVFIENRQLTLFHLTFPRFTLARFFAIPLFSIKKPLLHFLLNFVETYPERRFIHIFKYCKIMERKIFFEIRVLKTDQWKTWIFLEFLNIF